MNNQQAYNIWASQYDSNENKTRDLEAMALRESLSEISFENCLEIGCGTGKNTIWLAEKAKQITAVDLSEEMMAQAKAKVDAANVHFNQADITEPWSFSAGQYDLVVFSLVLEHIENLDHIFRETAQSLKPGGFVYIGELHPFRQYSGSKARFATAEGEQVLTCFNHHISDFILKARQQGLVLSDLQEYFDEGDRNGVPRILAMMLKKL